jgi:hypothetical protein
LFEITACASLAGGYCLGVGTVLTEETTNTMSMPKPFSGEYSKNSRNVQEPCEACGLAWDWAGGTMIVVRGSAASFEALVTSLEQMRATQPCHKSTVTKQINRVRRYQALWAQDAK